MKNFTVSNSEWISAGEMLMYVAIGSAVDYLAANMNILPLSPVVVVVLTPAIKVFKMFFDGKIN